LPGSQNLSGAAVSESAASARAARRVLAQWPFILACGIASLVAAYWLSTSRTPQYESSTSVRIGSENVAGLFVDQRSSTDADIQRETASAIASFTLPSVRERASAMLHGTVAPARIAEAMSVSSKPNTNIVKVAIRDPDAQSAQRISSAVTRAFIALRVEATRKKLTLAKSQVRRQFERLPASEQRAVTGRRLQDRMTELDTLIALADGNVDIVQTARVSEQPVSPRPKRDAILGLFTGLFLGALLATLRMRLDDRIRFTGELAEIWKLPVVGLVPQRNELRETGAVMPSADALESLWIARTNLRYLRLGSQVKLLLLTSAVQNEGKSTIAWNLALAASTAGSKVAVVEADLRRPALSRRLGLGGSGLSEVLAGLATLDDAIRPVPVSDGSGSVATSIDVVPAGMVPPNPLTLFEGGEITELFATLRERYDVVIIDTPPATVVADPLALIDDVDGVLIVSRLGVLRRSAFTRLRDVLTGVEAPVIGQLVNSERASSPAYGYGYDDAAATDASGMSVSVAAGRPARWRRLSPLRRQS
jgi:receptor protein-tyrosine kinase